LTSDPVAQLLNETISIQPEEYIDLRNRLGEIELIEVHDVSAALNVMVPLGSRTRVKQLILSHPDLLQMGFKLAGKRLGAINENIPSFQI
jgi:RecB family endonuclease NucS